MTKHAGRVIDQKVVKFESPVWRGFYREENEHQKRRVYGDEIELDLNRMLRCDLNKRIN